MDVVDIYFAALQLGKYPPPFTFTSVNHSYYQIFNFKWCASSVLLVCSTLVISSCSESPYMEMRRANCCQAEHYLNNYRLIDHLPCHWPFTMSYSSYTHGIIAKYMFSKDSATCTYIAHRFSSLAHFSINLGTMFTDLFLLLNAHKSSLTRGLLNP